MGFENASPYEKYKPVCMILSHVSNVTVHIVDTFGQLSLTRPILMATINGLNMRELLYFCPSKSGYLYPNGHSLLWPLYQNCELDPRGHYFAGKVQALFLDFL